jgi:hypothetical protein
MMGSYVISAHDPNAICESIIILSLALIIARLRIIFINSPRASRYRWS